MDALSAREALVARLERTGAIRSMRVAAAMRFVERERFVPRASLDEAYADQALVIKESGGLVLSSISQPSMVAHMLELLDVREGDRVLEIGTGSGYNAALLAVLAGESGAVVSVELEHDLLVLARERLDASGFEHATLLHDSELTAALPPFERIIVTARSSDIDARWWALLGDGGRIVVPLDIGYGGERAVAFERRDRKLISIGSCACAFVALRKAEPERDGAIFFRSRFERFRHQPPAHSPLEITAVQRDDANPSLLEEGDAVVAREHTLFSLRRL
jgi:protein-L-isoaspartate(D-aspartate) O-methyltransferase